MNTTKIIDEFKFATSNLLTFNHNKLINLLQKFNLLLISPDKYQELEGPLAPTTCQPTGYIQTPNPTGPDKMYAGPTGPLAYHTLDNYIRNIECYVDANDNTTMQTMTLCTFECTAVYQNTLKYIETLNTPNNYHTSTTKTIKRKILEYTTTIRKLLNLNADYKTTIRKEYDDNISTTEKIDTFTTAYNRNKEKIEHLTTEKEKLQKLLTPPPSTTKPVHNLPQSSPVSQNADTVQQLKEILQKLQMNPTTPEHIINSIQNKILELQSKYQ